MNGIVNQPIIKARYKLVNVWHSVQEHSVIRIMKVEK